MNGRQANFATNRNQNAYADPPKIVGNIRAATANNHKHRPPVLVDTFNSSQGFGSDVMS